MKFAFLPMLYTTGGVLAAGAGTYAVVERDRIFDAPPQAVVQQVETPKPEKQVALLDQPTAEEKAPKVEVEIKPKAPSFDVLRVEKDGSAVIAGSAPANSDVEIIDGDEVIAKVKSGPQGDFAIVLDKPLSVGTHELIIRATRQDEEPIYSQEAGIINIPEKESVQEVAVLVTKAGEASRILQTPIAKKEEPVAEPKVTESEVTEPKVAATPKSTVVLEAAEVEGGKIFIAGKGTIGSNVRLYLNNEKLGDALVNENGAFLYEGAKLLDAGTHKVRADVIDTSNGEVLARAEVNLLHEPTVVASAKPAQEDASVEIKLEEPAKTEAPAEATAPKEEEIETIRTGESVIIRRGDNLWQLAVRTYGSGVRYTTIFDANQDQVRDPDLIYPGQVLKVPEAAAEQSNGNAG